MKFYSTNLNTEPVSFSEALLKGLAPDKGLFLPETIPAFDKKEIDSFSEKAYHQIAYEVIIKYLKGEIEEKALIALVEDAYNYEVPLEYVIDNRFILRLDRGPTASFKDFAARMMGRLMNYYLQKQQRNLLILTATSGDTGSAIANAFYGLNNINVVVLFPEREVTSRQRKQMTTLGKNIQIITIDGKFDDCQSLVKEAFTDPSLNALNLSSANSINIGRLIPQIVYYFWAFARLRSGDAGDTVIFSVPSGNFGDMMGGMLAKRMGLPVKKFIIAVNENDEFPLFLKTEKYEKVDPSRNCLSSAMNVGHPSNLSRLVALYNGIMDEKGFIHKAPDFKAMHNDIFAVSVTDAATKRTIKETWDNYKVLLEPHGAVGWKGVLEYLKNADIGTGQLIVSLETAHPAKFPEAINEILRIDPELPESLKGLDGKPEFIDTIENNYEAFKKYLLKKYR
jgi:threonine synthase